MNPQNRSGHIVYALKNTGAALRSMGLALVVEFVCILLAGTVFTICALTYFITL